MARTAAPIDAAVVLEPSLPIVPATQPMRPREGLERMARPVRVLDKCVVPNQIVACMR